MTREGWVPEEFLGQIWHEGRWLDYARGTEAASKAWCEQSPEDRRVVDWIWKERVIFPPQVCWCGEPASYRVPVDPQVTKPNGPMSDGQPGILVCESHVDRDGYESL